jgi:putative heme transporter
MADADAASGRRGLRWLRYGVSVALVVAIFYYVLPQVADFSEVWRQIRALTGIELITLLLLATWNLVTYCFVWVASLPGLRYPQAAVVANSSNAVASTVPGGGAIAIGLTYSMLGSWGFSRGRSTISVLLSGVWNNFAKLAMPVIALALLLFSGGAGGGRVISGLFGIAGLIAAVVLFAAMLKSDEYAARMGIRAGRMANPVRRLFRMEPAEGWDLATVKFRNRTIGLVRERWLWLTLATVVSHLSLFLVLLVSLRDVGVSDDEVSWIEVLAAFAFVRLLTAIPVTPGGLGFIELGLTAGLVSAGGNREEVVAGILVFRFLTYLLPIPIGVGTYLFWQRNTSWRKEPAAESPPAATGATAAAAP